MPLYSSLSYNIEQDLDIEEVKGIQFSILSPNEILKRSVCEITKTDTYSANEPVINGLFDIRMGVLALDRLCGTCGLKASLCPNHMGHIKLETPLYNAMFFDITKKLLKCMCFHCSKLIISRDTTNQNYKDEITKILNIKNNQKRFDAYVKFISNIPSKIKIMDGCGLDGSLGCGNRLHFNVKKDTIKLKLEYADGDEGRYEMDILPDQVLKIFQRLNDKDIELLGFDPIWSRPEWLITTVLPVCPPAVRPSVIEESGQRREDDLTHKLCDIVKHNLLYKEKKLKNASPDILGKIAYALQYHVFTLLDNSIPGLAPSLQRNGRKLKSVSDRMKKKDGRIRGNLNAKRVDQSARSVITPDPYISIDQLGIPIKIAMNLTFPEIVNKNNYTNIQELVKKGPDEWPGAKYINKGGKNGKTINLKYCPRMDEANNLKIGDIVHRHLQDDDYVLFNRQPSLHKMSMMCHRAKVMQYKTFRLNVLDTPPYNADFDGDEMNMHYPQTVQTMNELRDLAYIPYMIISQKDGIPIIGMVQDVLLGSYRISDDKVKINCKDVFNLQMVNSNFQGKIKYKKEYTGKELFSLILPPNINTEVGKFKVKNSQINEGKLGKNSFKNRSKGLIPIIYHDFGPKVAMKFMDDTQRLICRWLMLDGFSVGLSDLVMSNDDNTKIKDIITNYKKQVYEKLNKFRKGELINTSIFSNEKFIETELINIMNLINKDVQNVCMDGKILNDDTNRMINMVNSGSKGKESNVTQIMGCVAQVKVEGKRIPYGFSNRTLPHYQKFDDGPEARGFVENGFIHGLTPQEVFFHAMGGREGLIDTAVKTSDTGYIQRRLVKSMEDVKIYYDYTVRNATGVIVQFVYGEDGMNGSKIENHDIKNLINMNKIELEENYLLSENDILNVYLLKNAVIETNKYLNKYRELFNELIEDREILITKVFDNKNNEEILYPIPFKRIFNNALNELNNLKIGKRKSDLDGGYILNKIEWIKKNLIVGINKECCLFFRILLNIFLNPKQILIKYNFNKKIFDYIIEKIIKYFKQSIAQPGEMVGIIAAQTIGEMGTQMTLDSFHVSGTDAAVNATSGVPRLKELLSVSKNIKTPMMNIYLKEDISEIWKNINEPDIDNDLIQKNKENVLNIKNNIEIIKFADIIEKSEIYWDDGQLSEINNDKEFIDLFNEFKQTCDNNRDDPFSNLVLRMIFNKSKLLEYKLNMIDIYTSLNLYYEQIVECIYSDDNAEQCIMRIKMINNSDNIYEQEDHLTLLKAIEYNIINNLLIKGIKNIKKVSLESTEILEYKNNEFKKVHKWSLNTDGSNMKDILLDINVNSYKTKSNDIREIYELLGIEAARKALTIELENVIGEGKLNYRHLSLLVDTMTSRGQLMSIDRHGINRSDVGPLAKSSFEETTDMLVNASIFSEYDNLNGISANVMLGHKAPCGTGDFNILINEDKFIDVMKDYNNIIIENNEDIEDNINDLDLNEDNIFIDVNLPEIKKNKSKCFVNRFN
jgi:DNA-directed RNA polymerase II subunit RPB1